LSNIFDIKQKIRFLNYNLNQNNNTAYELRREVILDDLSRKLDAEIIFDDTGFDIEEDGIKIDNANENKEQPTKSTQVLIRKLAFLQTDDFSDDKLKRKRDIITNNYLDVKINKSDNNNFVIKTNKGETEINLSQNQNISNKNG
jgi:hypothetical protein